MSVRLSKGRLAGPHYEIQAFCHIQASVVQQKSHNETPTATMFIFAHHLHARNLHMKATAEGHASVAFLSRLIDPRGMKGQHDPILHRRINDDFLLTNIESLS